MKSLFDGAERNAKGLVARWDAGMWARLREVEKSLDWIQGPREILCGKEEFVVLSNVRNGELWLRSYFEHYDRLGAKHYFILDNGSSDATISILKAHPKVTLVRSLLPFDEYHSDFYRFLTLSFGSDRWSLFVDQDHQFDYPGSDKITMSNLLRYLNSEGYDSVRTHIIDMFSNASISELDSKPEDHLREKYPFCDLSDLWAIPDPFGQHNSGPGKELPLITGGIRKTVFGTDWIWLTAHPLLFDSASILHPNGHSVIGARIADFSAMIWHYKFLSNFPWIAKDFLTRWEARTETTCSRAIFSEQDAYVRVMEKNPTLSLATGRPLFRPNSVDDFIRAGILQVSPRYEELYRISSQ